jgi:DNA-binding XRE family transcriptional regulator
MSGIHELLKALRLHHSYLQIHVAIKAQCCKATISRIESGKQNIRLGVLKAYSDIFNITLSDLFYLYGLGNEAWKHYKDTQPKHLYTLKHRLKAETEPWGYSYENMPKILKKLRVKNGYFQNQIAMIIGITSQPSISRIETLSYRRVKLEWLEAYACLLNTTLSEIFRLSELCESLVKLKKT